MQPRRADAAARRIRPRRQVPTETAAALPDAAAPADAPAALAASRAGPRRRPAGGDAREPRRPARHGASSPPRSTRPRSATCWSGCRWRNPAARSPTGSTERSWSGASMRRPTVIRDRLGDESRSSPPRELAIVLGSGLGGVVELLDPEPRVVIPYRRDPARPGGYRRPGMPGSWSPASRPGSRRCSSPVAPTPTRAGRSAQVDDPAAGVPRAWGSRRWWSPTPPAASTRPSTRRRDAHLRRHQPVGRQPAGRAEPRPASGRASSR